MAGRAGGTYRNGLGGVATAFPPLTPDHGRNHERSWQQDYHARTAGVTGDEWPSNSPPVAVIRPAPGTSREEAERSMQQLAELAGRIQTLLAELSKVRSEPIPQWQK